MKKPKRPKLPKRLKKNKAVKDLVQSAEVVAAKAGDLRNPHNKSLDEPLRDDVPQITNETIAQHREQVLSGARKYIYPLQHSKNRIVLITSVIVVGAIISFLVYCSFALYRYYQYNTFIYRVTQVAPFPVARVDNR